MNKPKILNKKATSIWISWVLLIAFTVVMGAFIYSFIMGYTLKSSGEIEQRADLASECKDTAVAVLYACQNTQNLYINVTNKGMKQINGFIFRLYDIYDQPEVHEINITLNPLHSKEIKLFKKGDIKKVNKLDLIPIIYKKNKINCEAKKAVTYDVKDCLER